MFLSFLALFSPEGETGPVAWVCMNCDSSFLHWCYISFCSVQPLQCLSFYTGHFGTNFLQELF